MVPHPPFTSHLERMAPVHFRATAHMPPLDGEVDPKKTKTAPAHCVIQMHLGQEEKITSA